MNPFTPTHEIYSDTTTELVHEEDGVLYTREEWENAENADWTRGEDGELLFQGQVRNGYGIRLLRKQV